MWEMAAVSFNKIRLHYYVSQGSKRAIWLKNFFHTPTRLFGTTLLAVNIALLAGSECSRQFYIAMDLNPSLAPITQIVLVLIFAELSPIFAARRAPEHVAIGGIGIVYVTSKILAPFLFIFEKASQLINRIFSGSKEQDPLFITREELQHILEDVDAESTLYQEGKEMNRLSSNLLALREKTAKLVMTPLSEVISVPVSSTVAYVRDQFKKTGQDFILLFHRSEKNIVGVAHPRQLLRTSDNKRVSDFQKLPWFITEDAKILQVLKQFRSKNQDLSIVLNHSGEAVGIVTLDQLVTQIFGKLQQTKPPLQKGKKRIAIDLTFPGSTKVKDINRKYDLVNEGTTAETLSDLITYELGHHPDVGESILVGGYELIVKEVSLLDIKTVLLRTRLK